MKIRSDKRCREAQRDPAAERMVRDGAAALRDAEIRTARGLARVHRTRTFLLSGCASAVDYGVRVGLSRRRALVLLRTGMALEADRDGQGERSLREGRITTEDAAEIGKLHAADERAAREAHARGTVHDPIVRDPIALPGADWFRRATEVPTTVLRKEIHERIEGHRSAERVRTISIATKESTIEIFRRSGVIASRRANEALSDGQTLTAVCDDYLSRHDPLRTKRRARRVGPTSERPRDRYVPAESFAAVLARSGDRCEVPGCGHRIFLELAHVAPHAAGGDREAQNLLRLCVPHHALHDAGRMRLIGWEDGRPVFVDAQTGEVFEHRRIERRIERRTESLAEPMTQPRTGSRAGSWAEPADSAVSWPPSVQEQTPLYGRRRFRQCRFSRRQPSQRQLSQRQPSQRQLRQRRAAGTCPAGTRRCIRAPPMPPP